VILLLDKLGILKKIRERVGDRQFILPDVRDIVEHNNKILVRMKNSLLLRKIKMGQSYQGYVVYVISDRGFERLEKAEKQ
jgi:hypothetical protein